MVENKVAKLVESKAVEVKKAENKVEKLAENNKSAEKKSVEVKPEVSLSKPSKAAQKSIL